MPGTLQRQCNIPVFPALRMPRRRLSSKATSKQAKLGTTRPSSWQHIKYIRCDDMTTNWYGIICIYIYIYIWLLIKILLSRNGHSSRIKILLSRNFCELHVYLSRGHNTSNEDSFTTCQITPENHGSLLGSLLNMQLASRNPFSGQIFFAKFTGPPPSTCTLTFARSFAWLSRNFRLFTDPGHQQGVHWRKSEDQGPWCLALAKPHFWKLGYCYSHSLVPFSCRTPDGSGWQPFT